MDNLFFPFPAYWELLHFSRVTLQYGLILAGACLLGVLAQAGIFSKAGSWLERLNHSVAFLGVLAALAFVCIAGLALLVLQDFPNSADEYSCIFLAKCFLAKKLYGVTDALMDFFHFTHIGEKDGKWFSVYPPGWPLLLCLGMLLKIPWVVNPLLGTLTLVFLYRIAMKVADARVAMLACLWTGASSFFLFNAASYYSHVPCLFLLSAFTWYFLIAMETGKNQGRYFLLSGLFLGYAMMTRYLSALLYGAPFGIYLLYRAAVRRDLSLRPIVIFTLGLAVFNLFQLWYQYRVTGNPFLTPIHYYREHEKLGFSKDFPPLLALGYTVFRLLFFAEWTVPGFWLFAVLAFFLPSKGSWNKIFLWAGLLCCIGYGLYFSFGGNGYGPRYCFEAIGVLGIMAAKAFYYFWDRFKSARIHALLGMALALGFFVNFWNVGQDIRRVANMTAARRSLYREVEKASLAKSVVFIRGWIGTLDPSDLTRNSPGRDDSVLYARDLGEKNKLLMHAMPGRSFYIGIYDQAAGIARLLPLEKSVS